MVCDKLPPHPFIYFGNVHRNIADTYVKELPTTLSSIFECTTCTTYKRTLLIGNTCYTD